MHLEQSLAKTRLKNFCFTLWVAVLLPTFAVRAQTVTFLHNFNGSDGWVPDSDLILSGDTLYGTTFYGGSFGTGVIFKMHTDGTGFTNLHVFSDDSVDGTNGDGASPGGNLVISEGTLYGTTGNGGLGGVGVVFAMKIDGTGFTNLHSFAPGHTDFFTFTNADGSSPYSLTICSNRLYGVTSGGGVFGTGTVFAMNTDGSGFTNLQVFRPLSVPYSGTNDDGAYPAGVSITNNVLYGATSGGGKFGAGSIFVLNTDGSGFSNLYNFTATTGSGSYPSTSPITNSDGATPQGIVVANDTLFGTTSYGGPAGGGTVFSIKTDGSGFKVLYSFSDPLFFTNKDGGSPGAGLILAGHTLYGTAATGGTLPIGTVFAVNTDGTGFTLVHDLAGDDGDIPGSGLVLSGNKLFGTAQSNGGPGYGTVFSIAFTPQLSVVRGETNVVLSWPTNAAGFDYTGFTLQSTTNLSSPTWSTVSSDRFILGGQIGVTNSISEVQRFYRLVQ